jgi:hypothetical protein
VTRGNATTSWHIERLRRIKMKGGNGSTTRGKVTICQRIERWQCIERVRGKGDEMRSNMTTNWGKQKENGKWKVEAAH